MHLWFKFVMLLTIFGTAAQASEAAPPQKVKTGILPSGAFYSLYEVSCDSGVTSAVVSLEGRSRWCATQDGNMVCMRHLAEASRVACASDGLIVAGRDESGAFDDSGEETRIN